MRDHIRREATQYLHAAWWLVPIAFATAALAAVVARDAEPPEFAVSAIPPTATRPAPAVMPAIVTVPASTTAQPQQAEPVYEVEHVQAF
jgi:hypothetical protein